jgi:hypothetical protein
VDALEQLETIASPALPADVVAASALVIESKAVFATACGTRAVFVAQGGLGNSELGQDGRPA